MSCRHGLQADCNTCEWQPDPPLSCEADDECGHQCEDEATEEMDVSVDDRWPCRMRLCSSHAAKAKEKIAWYAAEESRGDYFYDLEKDDRR